MIFIRLFALALLFHEGLKISTSGRAYLTRCFVPTFGLFLPPRQLAAVHIVLISLCMALLAWPQFVPLYPALLIALSLLVASYSLRLSNHLILAWFISLLLSLDLALQHPLHWTGKPTPFLYAGVQMLTILTYALAAFHKLNRDYLSPKISCGPFLARGYLGDRGLLNKSFERLLSWLSIYGVVAVEAVIPLCLLWPQTRSLGLFLAILLQITLGLLVHTHFSTLMFAALSAFVPPDAWSYLLSTTFAHPWPSLFWLILIGLYLGFRFGIWRAQSVPGIALAQQLFFGVYMLAALRVGWTLLHGKSFTLPYGNTHAASVLLPLIGAAYLFNGLCPYLGLKTNFSLAMFSNIRPDYWCHLIVRRPLRPLPARSYVRLHQISGLPEIGSHNAGPTVDMALRALNMADTLQYSSYFFHEALKLVCREICPPPVIYVEYSQGGSRYVVSDYAAEPAASCPGYTRLSLFPYTLPIDHRERYCD